MSRRSQKAKPATVETGPMVVEAMVDNPLSTWAQFLHEVDVGLVHPGKTKVMLDRRQIMGGFCRFHGNEAQEQAAARFKSIHERSQLGGAKAVDPSRETVDGGGVNPESVIEIGADARRLYNQIFTAIGRQDMMRLEFVVVGDKGPTAYARWRYRTAQPDGRTVGQGSVEVRGIVERVAVLLKLQNRRDA